MSFSVKLGNFLFKNAFGIYKLMYYPFKRKQDAFEISLLQKYVHEGDNIIDIGANIGFYAEILSALAGEKGKVHCFEPDKINFGHLEKTCASLKNVILQNKAVGAESGVLTVYTSKELNVDHRTYQTDNYDGKFEIPAVSLDDYLKDEKVDFIKMDIQGFEMSAVKGMKKTLEKNREVKILSEYWPYGLKKAGSSGQNYFLFLIDAGFKIFLLEKNALIPLTEEKVLQLEKQQDHKEFYYNIFAYRENV